MKSKITLILVLFGLQTFAQSDTVSAGSTSYSAGYEISETYGKVFRFSYDYGYTVIEGVQQPFKNSGLAVKSQWISSNVKVYPNPSIGPITIEAPIGFQQ